MEEEIIYYKDNPNLNLLTVTTINGETEYRQNCRKIKHDYYIKNKDCFIVNGVWYRVNSGLIVFDHYKKEWVMKNANLKKGIVSIDENNVPVIGFFTEDLTQNVKVYYNDEIIPGVSEEAVSSLFRERLSDGIFYDKNRHSASFFTTIKNVVNNKEKGYNIEDNAAEFEQKKMVYANHTPNIPLAVFKYAKYLEDTSFGCEIEAIHGYLPDNVLYRTGTVICRDGSLHAKDGSQGPEYTTIPMQGAKGVQSLIDLAREISKRNIIDHQCSLHLHLGNLPTTRLFIVSLYKLSMMIQDDLFKMFPYYKNDEPRYAGKDKNYCAKLQPMMYFGSNNKTKEAYERYVDDYYLRIFTYLSNNTYPSSSCNRKIGAHPRNHKWERTGRYHWINFINVLFSKRNTVEFRIHQGTSNPQKIVSWLFLCNAIVKSAMFYSNKILRNENVTLDDVFNYYANRFKTPAAYSISNYLRDYYISRVNLFNDLYEKKDYLGMSELQEDKEFKFDYSVFSNMFNH